MLAFHVHDSRLVFHGMEIHEFAKLFQFPMDWGWMTGFGCRKDFLGLYRSQTKGSQNPSVLETPGILGNL